MSRQIPFYLGLIVLALSLVGASLHIGGYISPKDSHAGNQVQVPERFHPGPSNQSHPFSNQTVPTTNPADNFLSIQPDEFNLNNQPKVAIVIDDLGNNRRTVDAFEQVNQPLTMAVIPNRPYSQQLYNRWKDRFEFIIHMPMEPENLDRHDPGNNALLTNMSGYEIRSRIQKAIRNFPEAVGLNNHMGSKFTSENVAMSYVMQTLHQRGLFFLDSNTTPNSVAPRLANRYQVPVNVNNLFLDNVESRKHVADKLDLLVEIAKRDGSAIGIGHIQVPETARVLAEKLPELKQEVDFVPLSELIQ